MSNATPNDEEKVAAYLDVIQQRILTPLQNAEIRRYCTATLLLLFAAIDGLGKLLADDDKAKSNQRILRFLDYMGGKYAGNKRKLLDLRHSLVHNAISVESYLSNTEITREQHLERIGAAGFILVSTVVMYTDFVDAFKRFQDELKSDGEILKRAARRLEWREEAQLDESEMPGTVSPSSPSPVSFIFAK